MPVEMDGVDEPNFRFRESHDQRMRAGSVAEERNAVEQAAAGDSGAGGDDFFAWSQICSLVNSFWILDTHLRDAIVVFRLINDEARENFAIQAAQSRCGENPLRSAARAHHGVYRGAASRCGDPCRKVPIGNKAYARAGGANVADQLLMAGAVEDDDDQIFDVAVIATGNRAQVVFSRGVEIDGSLCGRPDDDFFHVQVRGMK